MPADLVETERPALFMAKEILLTRGRVTIVDDEDYDWLNQWKWVFDSGGYASRTLNHIMMHRVIMDPPEGVFVDHRNRNKLDNRRSNLRLCTKSQNNMNQSKRRDNTSGYVGVCWFKPRKKWRVEIRVEGKRIFVGSYANKIEAARFYNMAAMKYHGYFAKLNEIPSSVQ